MKRVLVDMHRLGKCQYNGIYVYVYNLARELAKSHPPDLELHYYIKESLFGMFDDRVKYLKYSSFDKFFHRKAIGFDIWHSTVTHSWYMPADKRTKFIFTIHDINFITEYTPKRAKRYLRRIQKRVDRADHFIAISEFALKQAQTHLDLGNKPCSIIYPGCIFITEKPTAQKPVYVPGKKFLFTIGAVIRQKNFHVAVPLLVGNDYEYV